VEILARGGKCFRSSELKVPQLVFHPAVEFVWILLPLRVEFHTDGGILQIVQDRSRYIGFTLLLFYFIQLTTPMEK